MTTLLSRALFAAVLPLAPMATCTPTGGGSTPSSDAGIVADSGSPPSSDAAIGTGCGTCPTGYTCGSANGLAVCRAPSGVPVFSNVWVIPMENTSLSTLQSAISGGTAPYIGSVQATYASSSNYHGVGHPSLPNYIAMTSGGTQGIACDCKAQPGQGTCNSLSCNALASLCTCTQSAESIADQIEAANLTWYAYAENMGTPCNVVDTGEYVARHVPFLYYDSIQTNASRCNAHVLDFSQFNTASSASFNYLVPNLVDDMHDPDPVTSAATVNIPNGDSWLKKTIPSILQSAEYQKGGLIAIVWDEDDASGLLNADAPIGLFILSPYAKPQFVSGVHADHYSLLATVEDGLGLARLGSAASATPLGDFFPSN